MASKGTLTVRLVGDSKPLERTLGNIGGKLGGFVKAVGAASAAAVGVVAVKGIQAAREAEKINRITANVIKTTGGAANVTAQQVDDLSGRLQKLTGVSDETIQRGSNMLLTFTNIRNEVGKNNDIFDQATGIALDLSVAMGTDVKDSAIQVGKALNDPIKGISALSRVGIQFTDQQKEQIATMMESGDVLGAQKVILAELEKQFGGTAEAAADPMQKLIETISDMVEVVGTWLLPVVDRLANWLNDRLPGAIAAAEGFFRSRLLPVFDAVKGWWDENGPRIIATAEDVWSRVTDAVGAFADRVRVFWEETVQPVLVELREAWEASRDEIEQVAENIGRIVSALGGIFASEFSRMEGDVQGSTEGMSEDLGTTIDAIAGITEALADLVEFVDRNMETFQSIAEPFRVVTDFVMGVLVPVTQLRDRLQDIRDLTLRMSGEGKNFGGGFKASLVPPEIVGLAHGGVIDRPTLALVGENPSTTPEIVAPEGTLRRIFREEAGQSSGGGPAINVQVYGDPSDSTLDQMRHFLRLAMV